jgi:hypothetical protein
MSSKLITFLLAVIVAILLTSGGMDAEIENNKNVAKIVFHVPPTLKNGAVPKYNSWLELQSTVYDEPTDDKDIFYVMKHHPKLTAFFNIINDHIDINTVRRGMINDVYTIFAPIISDDNYWKNLPNIKDVIQYHILLGKKYDLGSLDLGKKYIIERSGPIVYKLRSGYVRIDCTAISSKPIIAKNDVIYPILRPLSPERKAAIITALKAGREPAC